MSPLDRSRRWWVLAAVSLLYAFCVGATFSSLGIVLYTMAGELHWSMAQAGISFSVLGLACCFSSPLPPVLIRRLGSRATLFVGSLLLLIGFIVAWRSASLTAFYVAMALVGTGFTLGANIPGVFLLVGWFGRAAGRMIGLYLMLGALGGVVAPPLVQALVGSGGWRLHWLVMAAIAAAVAVIVLVCVRDVGAAHATAEPDVDRARADTTGWTYRTGIATPQFAVLAMAMVVTQTTVTTLNSAAVPHFVHVGSTAPFAALMLSLQALLATLAKGLAGALPARIDARHTLVAGLLVQSLGLLFLGTGTTPGSAYLFAIAFGLGWGSVYYAVTVLVIGYFGRVCGTTLMSTVWLLTGFAAGGPALAGWIADRYGTFAPVFDACAVLLLPIAVTAFAMRAPHERRMPGTDDRVVQA